MKRSSILVLEIKLKIIYFIYLFEMNENYPEQISAATTNEH